MEEYDKLVEQNQSGQIDDLDFLLAQEINPDAAITVPGINKRNEVKQLTFNF